jgi:hypothetical protein
MYQQNNQAGAARQRFDVARLNAWIEEAQPGARIVYFHGRFAGDGDKAVNAQLLAEEERGMIFLFQDRRSTSEVGHDYVAERSSRPFKGARPLTMAEQARAEGERAFRSSGR